MRPPPDAPLAAFGLHKSYESGGVTALADVDFQAPAGLVVAVTGASGSGKTTLLNLLGLLDTPDSGEIWIDGRRADDASARQARRLRGRHLGFVFQDALLDPDRTAGENVATGLRFAGVPRAERGDRVRATLRSTGTADRVDARGGVLSGGERQRVAVARAIAHRPAVLLCDEPTGSLDEDNTEVVFALLVAHSRTGAAVVVVTHDLELAGRCDARAHLTRSRLEWR